MTEAERRAALYLAGRIHGALLRDGLSVRTVDTEAAAGPTITVGGPGNHEVTLTFTAVDGTF